MLLIGGDHTAQIGQQDNTGRDKTIQQFGLSHNSATRDEVVEWAQLNKLRIVDRFVQMKNRETCCRTRTENWCEVIYLLTRKHRYLYLTHKKTVPEDRWSEKF